MNGFRSAKVSALPAYPTGYFETEPNSPFLFWESGDVDGHDLRRRDGVAEPSGGLPPLEFVQCSVELALDCGKGVAQGCLRT